MEALSVMEGRNNVLPGTGKWQGASRYGVLCFAAQRACGSLLVALSSLLQLGISARHPAFVASITRLVGPLR